MREVVGYAQAWEEEVVARFVFYRFTGLGIVVLGWALCSTVLYLVRVLFPSAFSPVGVFEGFNEARWVHVC